MTNQVSALKVTDAELLRGVLMRLRRLSEKRQWCMGDAAVVYPSQSGAIELYPGLGAVSEKYVQHYQVVSVKGLSD